MAFTQVTVTGSYQFSDGTPAEGSVVFTPTATMRNATAAAETNVSGPIVAGITAGALSVSLAATDDTGTTPTGVTYKVEERINRQAGVRTYYLPVPSASPTLDLDAAQIVETIPGAITVPVGGPQGPQGDPGPEGPAGTLADGSVTNVKVASNAAISADKLADGTAKKVLTAAERTQLGGLQTALDGKQPTPQIDVFTSSGTWTKPAWATVVTVVCFGAGGGGGSGARQPSGTATSGGAGGGAGAWATGVLPAALLGATEPVTVGAGGAGGTARATNATNGAAGTSGGPTRFGGVGADTRVKGSQGGSGAGGGTTVANGGFAGLGIQVAAVGPSSVVGGAGTSATTPAAGAGPGGAGGGISTTPAAFAGGNGSASQMLDNVGAASGGAINTNGGAGLSPTITAAIGGGGGGGGGASITTAGGSGGNGGSYGSGGGGGGSSLDGFNSGAGGAGGAGILIVISE